MPQATPTPQCPRHRRAPISAAPAVGSAGTGSPSDAPTSHVDRGFPRQQQQQQQQRRPPEPDAPEPPHGGERPLPQLSPLPERDFPLLRSRRKKKESWSAAAGVAAPFRPSPGAAGRLGSGRHQAPGRVSGSWSARRGCSGVQPRRPLLLRLPALQKRRRDRGALQLPAPGPALGGGVPPGQPPPSLLAQSGSRCSRAWRASQPFPGQTR